MHRTAVPFVEQLIGTSSCKAFRLLKTTLVTAATLSLDCTAPNGEMQQIVVTEVLTGDITRHAMYE